MRRLLALFGTAGLALSLAACGGSAEQPAEQPAGTTEQGQVGSPGQELAGIGSTLDAIDSELASDGSP
jgi:hypothetical protein